MVVVAVGIRTFLKVRFLRTAPSSAMIDKSFESERLRRGLWAAVAVVAVEVG